MGRHDYDLLVIGGGAAGFVASKLARGLGRTVAMVEKGRLGGDCTWYGCIPSKTLIKAAGLAHQLKNPGRYGLGARGPEIDTGGVMSHVRDVVRSVYQGHTPEVFEGQGIRVIHGDPRFVDNHTIEIEGRRITSRAFIISTGSSPAVPPLPGLDAVPYLTNRTFFDLPELPSSMIVLGSGPIGMELSSAMNRLGVAVTVVGRSETILPREEGDLMLILEGLLREEGLTIMNRTKALAVRVEGGRTVLSAEDERGRKRELPADSLLVATGRVANVRGLGLESAGVEYTDRGIRTDGRLRTTAPNIYACGDVTGPYLFSHVAEYQARIAVQNALLPFKKRVSYDNVAWCIFTAPEIARAGLTEREARERHGDGIRVYSHAYRDTDRAKTDSATEGMAKLITDRKGRILGIHILGARAGEIIHEPLLARSMGLPLSRLDSLIHVYPTFSDVVKQTAKSQRIERLRENPFVRIVSRLSAKKG